MVRYCTPSFRTAAEPRTWEFWGLQDGKRAGIIVGKFQGLEQTSRNPKWKKMSLKVETQLPLLPL